MPVKKLNTKNLPNRMKRQKPKDIYPFIIDCSLDKKGNILIYELQPLVCSGLGGINSKPISAFKKAFPDLSFILDYKGFQYSEEQTGEKTGEKKIIISDKFLNGNHDQNFNTYTYVHTPKDSVINQLGNKINQRLYLPSEVSPKYVLFDLSADRDKEVARIVNYFNERQVEKIVLKHPEACMGDGNVFIDSIQNEDTIKQGIEKLIRIKYATTSNFPYLLVESQSAFLRVSRKTGEVKPGFTTYRIVGITSENGSLGYFIATKSISSNIDSHQRNFFKFYFNGLNDPDYGNRFIHCKPKDKYFNLGTNRIPINSKFLEKAFKSVYRLYHDLQNMTGIEFKTHIDSLILSKKENKDLNKLEELYKGLYESFLSQFKLLNSKDEITVKASIKKEPFFYVHVLTSQPKFSPEISLFLKKIVSKDQDITIKEYSSPRSFFFPIKKDIIIKEYSPRNFSSSVNERSLNIKITLPNVLSSYQILIAAVKETIADIPKSQVTQQKNHALKL